MCVTIKSGDIMANYSTGFYQNDLSAKYELYDTIDKTGGNRYPYKNLNHLYKFFYLIKGTARVRIGEKSYDISKNTLVISRNSETFNFKISFEKEFEYLLTDIHPSLFNDLDDNNFLRAFDLKDDERILDLNNKELVNLKSIIDSFVYNLQRSASRCHVLPRVMTIISELAVITDRLHPKKSTDEENISVRLVYYVLHNYTKKITYETLKGMFYISAPTINTIFKNYTGLTLNQLITNLRLNDAENMLESGLYTTKETAKLCGFSDYTTFYRAFKKKFGYTPIQKKKKNTYWPLSKK